MMKSIRQVRGFLLLSALITLGGCSSSPSDRELLQLNELKANVTRLDAEIKKKQEEKVSLDRQVAEKNARLKLCQSDQDAVRKAVGK